MKVVRLSALGIGRLYPQEIFLVLISVRSWVNSRVIVWPEGLCQRKILMTPSTIDPATFGLLVQCLNQLHHCVKTSFTWWVWIKPRFPGQSTRNHITTVIGLAWKVWKNCKSHISDSVTIQGPLHYVWQDKLLVTYTLPVTFPSHVGHVL